MKLTEAQIEIMKEDMSIELISLIMQKWHCSMEEAMDALYNSDTFSRLEDSRTGLYYQSPGYVYSFLDKELASGSYKE